MHRNLRTEDKEIYVEGLIYILNLGEKKVPEKQEYIRNRLDDMCIDCSNTLKRKAKKKEQISLMLKSIRDVKVKRFILREMILLAISDHEIDDEEISSIYKIGMGAGIKEDKVSDFFIWAAKGLEWQIEGSKLLEEDI